MMPTTGDAKFPYPNSSEIPDGPAAFLLLGQRLALMNGAGVSLVADATERAALVTDGDAFEGMYVVQVDTATTYRYLSSAWKLWELGRTSYTPTVSNFNSSSTAPTISGWYSVSSGIVDFGVTAKLGTGTITVSAISISTPVAIDTTGMILGSTIVNGSASFEDVSAGSTGYFGGQIRVTDANTVTPLRYSAANAGVIAVTSSSLPFTWATLDVMTASGRYPAA